MLLLPDGWPEDVVVGRVFELRPVLLPQPEANAEAEIEVTARIVSVARIFFMAVSKRFVS